MLLGAHHGEPCLTRPLDEPAGPGGELLRLHVIRIAAKRFVPQSRVPRIRSRPAEAAERPALPLIADAVLGKRTLQRNPIELGMAARAGVGAHINQQLDTGDPEHGGQFLHGACAMADGPDFHRVHETGLPEGYCPKSAKRMMAMADFDDPLPKARPGVGILAFLARQLPEFLKAEPSGYTAIG